MPKTIEDLHDKWFDKNEISFKTKDELAGDMFVDLQNEAKKWIEALTQDYKGKLIESIGGNRYEDSTEEWIKHFFNLNQEEDK